MALPIVNSGLAILAKRLQTQNGESSPTQPEPKFMGWGTGTTAAAMTDTNLTTPSPEGRLTGTSSITTTNVPNDTYQITGTIVSANVQTISELGLFDSATGGSLFMHLVFTGLPVNPGDGIVFTIKTFGT